MGAFTEAFLGLIFPWHFMYCSVSYLPSTILSLLGSRDFGTLLSWDALQAVWFARFWSWAGPRVKETAEKRVLPLLEGRVQAGHLHEKPVMPPVSGVVIEIGPGTGMWVDIFSKVDTSGTASASGAAGGKGDEVRKRGKANDVTKVSISSPLSGSRSSSTSDRHTR